MNKKEQEQLEFERSLPFVAISALVLTGIVFKYRGARVGTEIPSVYVALALIFIIAFIFYLKSELKGTTKELRSRIASVIERATIRAGVLVSLAFLLSFFGMFLTEGVIFLLEHIPYGTREVGIPDDR